MGLSLLGPACQVGAWAGLRPPSSSWEWRGASPLVPLQIAATEKKIAKADRLVNGDERISEEWMSPVEKKNAKDSSVVSGEERISAMEIGEEDREGRLPRQWRGTDFRKVFWKRIEDMNDEREPSGGGRSDPMIVSHFQTSLLSEGGDQGDG